MAGQLKYQKAETDEHDDSSTTEFEDSVLGDEKELNDREFGRSYRPRSRSATCLSILKEARWFIDTILLLVIIGLLLLNQSRGSITKNSEREVGGDFTGVGRHSMYTISVGSVSSLTITYSTHGDKNISSQSDICSIQHLGVLPRRSLDCLE